MNINESIVEDATLTWFGELCFCTFECVAEEVI